MSLELYEKHLLSVAHGGETIGTQINPVDMEKEAKYMTEHLLGQILKELYEKAPRGFQVASIHVFSIYYANTITEDRLNKKEILKAAGLPEPYQTEISKGINLAQYVSIKEQMVQRIAGVQAALA